MTSDTTLEALIGRLARDPVATARLASVLLARGELPRAKALLDQAVQLAPGNGEVRLRAAELASHEAPPRSLNIFADQRLCAGYDATLRRVLRPENLVLDIDGETGVLAMLAARAGAHVLVCNPKRLVADAVATVIGKNGWGHRIQVSAKQSVDLQVGVDLERPADAIIWGDRRGELVSGDVLATLDDALRRLARPGAYVVPARAKVRAALVEDTEPFHWQMGVVRGFDLSVFSALARPRFPILSPGRFAQRSNPVDLFEFDLESCRSFLELQRSAILAATGTRADGVASWVVPALDEGASEDSPQEFVAMGGVFHRFPQSLNTRPGGPVAIRASHDGRTLRIWPDSSSRAGASRGASNEGAQIARRAGTLLKEGDVKAALALCDAARTLAPDDGEVTLLVTEATSHSVPAWHFGITLDSVLHELYEEVFRRNIRPGDLVLDIGSGTGLFALMAARAGANVVTCEQNPVVAEIVAKIVASNGFADRVKVVSKSSSDLIVGVDLERAADVIVWDNLANNLIGAGALPAVEQARRRLARPGARVIPQRARIRVALAEEPERSRTAESVAGFDLSFLDRSLSPRVLMSTRQGQYAIRSTAVDIFNFDFQMGGPFPGAQTSATLTTEGGRVNGVAQWVLLELDEMTSDENWPPRSSRRGLVSMFHRFARAFDTRSGDLLTINASHDRETLRIWADVPS